MDLIKICYNGKEVKFMDNTDKIIQQIAEETMDMYLYAKNNNLDISNPEDIKKILEALNKTDETVDSAMQSLAVFDQFIQQDLERRKKVS